jgi:hypothetical protein
MKKWIENNWLKILAILLLLGTFYSFPFVYFQLMNWVVAICALTTAWSFYKAKKKFLMWVLIGVAIAFNPLAPLYLSQILWRYLDVIVAALFLVLMVGKTK